MTTFKKSAVSCIWGEKSEHPVAVRSDATVLIESFRQLNNINVARVGDELIIHYSESIAQRYWVDENHSVQHEEYINGAHNIAPSQSKMDWPDMVGMLFREEDDGEMLDEQELFPWTVNDYIREGLKDGREVLVVTHLERKSLAHTYMGDQHWPDSIYVI